MLYFSRTTVITTWEQKIFSPFTYVWNVLAFLFTSMLFMFCSSQKQRLFVNHFTCSILLEVNFKILIILFRYFWYSSWFLNSVSSHRFWNWTLYYPVKAIFSIILGYAWEFPLRLAAYMTGANYMFHVLINSLMTINRFTAVIFPTRYGQVNR